MPKEVEPIGNEHRIDFLHRLGKSNLRTILFYRPLIAGYNTSEEQMKKVLTVAKDANVDAIVIGAVMWSNSITQLFEERVGPTPINDHQNYRKKILMPEYKRRLIEFYMELGLTMPMVRRTSCVRSVARNMPDYNGHWIEPEKNCWPTCPEHQQFSCANQGVHQPDEVRYLLNRIDRPNVLFDINPNKSITIHAELGREDVNFLRTSLHTMVYLQPL